MIFDRLDRASRYGSLPAGVVRALEFLARMPADLPTGRADMGEGDALFALVSESPTRPEQDAKWEVHHRYFDVQYLARGAERFGYADEEGFSTTSTNDARDTDLLDVTDACGPLQFLTLAAGHFIVLWPGEAHLPGVALDGTPSAARKIVVKVRAD